MTQTERAAQYLAVKDFEKFQHYKDRNPPWIKLYASVLSNYVITSLPDAAQGQLFKLWLMASRHENKIPYDLRFIRQEIKPTGRLFITELIASGLIAVCQHDASTTLAPRALAREESNGVTSKQAVRVPPARALNGALDRNMGDRERDELEDINRRRGARGEEPIDAL